MASFSKEPTEAVRKGREQGYVSVAFEQGVPVLDRDLNLLGALPLEATSATLDELIGAGADASREGFGISALPSGDENDFLIATGVLSLPGVSVENRTEMRYSRQDPSPPPLTPFTFATDERARRRDVVYLDAWTEQVGSEIDAALENRGDVGIETSMRRRSRWRVRVAEGAEPPPPEAGHVIYPLADIVRLGDGRGSVIDPWMIEDRRREALTLADASRRLDRIEDTLAPSIERVVGFNSLDQTPPSSIGIFGDRFDLGTTPAAMTLGGVALTPVLREEDFGFHYGLSSVNARERFIAGCELPAWIRHGTFELVVSNEAGKARCAVTVLERWTVVTGSGSVPSYSYAYRGWASDVASSPSIQSVWIVGDQLQYNYGYPIQRWAGGTSWDNAVGVAMRIAVDPQGSLWVVTNDGTVYFGQWNGTYVGWYPWFSGSFIDVAVGADGSVWRLDAQGISKYDGSSWGAPIDVPGGGYRVAVDLTGHPWVVTAAHEIKRYDGQTWEAALQGQDPSTTMKANDVAVGGDGTLWIVGELGPNGDGRVYARRGGAWHESDCWGVSIGAGSDGRPWVVDANNVIRRRDLEVTT